MQISSHGQQFRAATSLASNSTRQDSKVADLNADSVTPAKYRDVSTTQSPAIENSVDASNRALAAARQTLAAYALPHKPVVSAYAAPADNTTLSNADQALQRARTLLSTVNNKSRGHLRASPARNQTTVQRQPRSVRHDTEKFQPTGRKAALSETTRRVRGTIDSLDVEHRIILRRQLRQQILDQKHVPRVSLAPKVNRLPSDDTAATTLQSRLLIEGVSISSPNVQAPPIPLVQIPESVASIRIQMYVRGWLARLLLHRRISAAQVIQSVHRGSRVRAKKSLTDVSTKADIAPVAVRATNAEGKIDVAIDKASTWLSSTSKARKTKLATRQMSTEELAARVIEAERQIELCRLEAARAVAELQRVQQLKAKEEGSTSNVGVLDAQTPAAAAAPPAPAEASTLSVDYTSQTNEAKIGLIQAAVRGKQARAHAARLAAEHTAAVRMIQAAVRGKQARAHASRLAAEKAAVRMIQAAVRGKQARAHASRLVAEKAAV
eukprot:SAG31_NODE_5718_length_2363_cov_53.435954_1_plen_494_part_10